MLSSYPSYGSWPSRQSYADDDWRDFQAATDLLSLRSAAQVPSFVRRHFSDAHPSRSSWQAGPATQQLATLIGTTARQVLPRWAERSSSRDDRLYRGRLLGLELEGLSPEDQELELARHFLRFSGDVLMRLNPGRARAADVRRAFRASARRYAPGLFRTHPVRKRRLRIHNFPLSGRWSRRGYTITLRP